MKIYLHAWSPGVGVGDGVGVGLGLPEKMTNLLNVNYTKILEVNLFAFVCTLFHEDFSPIDGALNYLYHCTLISLGFMALSYVP